MTLPCDTRLNDTPAGGPLTAADFDTYQSPETAMLLHQDFVDTVAVPRRQSAPMSFEPAWYRGGVATCGGVCHQGRDECQTPDACRLPVRDDISPVFSGLLSWPCLLSAALMLGIVAWAVWY